MFDDAQLLLAWERSYGEPPHRQALALLATAFPSRPEENLMALTIGQRDAELLQLRRALFGRRLETLANCPACKETMEVDVDVDQILAAGASVREHSLSTAGYQIEFRVPTVCDLLAVEALPSECRAEDLFLRCIAEVRRNDQSIAARELEPQVREKVAAAICVFDPHADIRLALACPSCEHAWESPLDIVSLLWSELNAACQRLLTEIHTLALAYGWSEPQILALSRWRRQVYLNMVRQ